MRGTPYPIDYPTPALTEHYCPSRLTCPRQNNPHPDTPLLPISDHIDSPHLLHTSLPLSYPIDVSLLLVSLLPVSFLCRQNATRRLSTKHTTVPAYSELPAPCHFTPCPVEPDPPSPVPIRLHEPVPSAP